MKITGSQVVIECLVEQGVDTIFGYPCSTRHSITTCEPVIFI